MVKNPKKPFLKREKEMINVSSRWFNMARQRGMPCGRIDKVSVETLSLVSFSDPSQTILETR